MFMFKTEKMFVELLIAAQAMMEYIDAIPDDVELPAMPGFDRDGVDDLLYECEKLSERIEALELWGKEDDN